jgi:peptide/nickel transport system permease protein
MAHVMTVRAKIGLLLLLMLVSVAALAPWISPNDPLAVHVHERLSPPSRSYPLGTDDLGRCVLSRLLYGMRLSLGISVVVVALSASLGTVAGIAAGYGGALVDEILMRLVDALLAVPGLVLALVIAGLLGPGAPALVLGLCATGWMRYARVVRGIVVSTKHSLFIDATRALGAPGSYILTRHVLPEVLPSVQILASLGMSGAILSIAALSFLGLGLQPPSPEWGSMLQAARPYLRTAPALMMLPGAAILLTAVVFRLLSEGLGDPGELQS